MVQVTHTGTRATANPTRADPPSSGSAPDGLNRHSDPTNHNEPHPTTDAARRSGLSAVRLHSDECGTGVAPVPTVFAAYAIRPLMGTGISAPADTTESDRIPG